MSSKLGKPNVTMPLARAKQPELSLSGTVERIAA